jgi:tetratricopeptide (TPR) repeat protein
MIRFLCASLSVLVVTATGSAQPSLKTARQLWLRGNYDESLELYERLAEDAKLRPAVAVGVSRVHQSRGDYDKALEAIETALKAAPKDADVLARQADLLYLRGKWDEAEKATDAALAVDKDNFGAHWARARIHRDRGELKKADDDYLWFVRAYNRLEDVKVPEVLLLIGLASAEHARYVKLSDEFQTVLDDLYGEAVKLDKSFWPALYESGVIWLEKYDRPEAVAFYDKALTINSQCAEALTGKGVAALMKLDLKEAEGFAEKALKINPNLPEALRLRADLHFFVGDFPAAVRELEKAQKVNPRDEHTLARLAACLKGQRKDDEFDALVKGLEKFDTKPAVFWQELGEQTEVRRLFSDAEKYYRTAMGLRPTMSGPLNSLGMLYMRLGREREASDLLNKGFEADPFNVRVLNMRKVLKHLSNYATLKTDHFELRYDPKSDGPLARYMAEQLEQIYKDLAKEFNHEPKGPILIEVFNSHMFFSGRTIALPDLHTIGACTGRMIAMDSPHAAGIRQPFNWARVLRHEIVHIFNLDQTDFQVPHWLTEGLAVSNEGFPRPQPWNQLLLERVPADDVLDLDNINLGFMRPKNPGDWHMAYCQSLLYVEYIRKEFKDEAIGDLLKAYKDGLDTSAAIRRVCKQSKADFEKGYRKFLDDEVKKIRGKAAEKKKTFAELKAAHEKDPKDADAAAAYAEAALERRDRIEARKAAEAAIAQKKDHPLASIVLARLERIGGNLRKERELLEAAYNANKDNADPRLLRALGKLYYEAEEFAEAAKVLEKGREAEKLDSEWAQQLMRVYARKGDKDKLIDVLKDLVPTDADQFDWRKRLTRLLLETEKFADAETYAKQCLEIDVADAEVQEMLQKALKGQKTAAKDAEAERLAKLLAK